MNNIGNDEIRQMNYMLRVVGVTLSCPLKCCHCVTFTAPSVGHE